MAISRSSSLARYRARRGDGKLRASRTAGARTGNLLAHMRAEACLDVDALVETLSDDVHGHAYREHAYTDREEIQPVDDPDAFYLYETRKLSPGEIGSARFAA